MAQSPFRAACNSLVVDFDFTGSCERLLSSLPADVLDDVLSCGVMDNGAKLVSTMNGVCQRKVKGESDAILPKLRVGGSANDDMEGSDVEIDVDGMEQGEAQNTPSLNVDGEKSFSPVKTSRRLTPTLSCSNCGAELISPCRAVFPQLCPACRLLRNGQTGGNRLQVQPAQRSSRPASPSKMNLLVPSVGHVAKAEPALKEESSGQAALPSPDVDMLSDSATAARAQENLAAADTERFYFESDHLALKNNPE